MTYRYRNSDILWHRLRRNAGRTGLLIILSLSSILAGCRSDITPLRPAAIGPPWADKYNAAPKIKSTPLAKTEVARVSAFSPHWFLNAKNATVVTINDETYGHIWHQAVRLLIHMGYRIDWRDYNLGVITTYPRTGPEILQFWRPDATSLHSLVEGTINTFRRLVRIAITPMHHKSGVYRISIEVLVEQRENPQGGVTGVAFLGSSSFGANPQPFVSQFASPTTPGRFWMRVGRDTALEKKISRRLLRKL
ncbi:MAG: hypothetical protein ACP5O1_06890 [Phycisphaerae bacterium]